MGLFLRLPFWTFCGPTATILLSSVLLVSNHVMGVVADENPIFDRFENLSHHLSVAWTIDLDQKTVTFTVTGKTTGWIGFGLSSDGGMNNADLVIGGVDHDGQVYFTDRFSSGQFEPKIDDHADWFLLEGEKNGGVTTLKFYRKFDTCDPEDLPITSSTSFLIWGMGETDKINQHKMAMRGQKSINLLDRSNPKIDTSRFDVWNITLHTIIPAKDTTYWCTVHQSPYRDKIRRHIVGFSVMLNNEESLTFNHHLAFHRCLKNPAKSPNVPQNPNGVDCFEAGTVYDLKWCKTYLFVWAKGGTPLFLPENAGIPLNENEGAEEYFLLNFHYDNPEIRSGVQYETGITIYTTDKTRDHDVGVLVVGHDVSNQMIVPPMSTNFVQAGHCSSNCTAKSFPPQGINIFNVLLHAHLAGRKLKLRHFRNDQELPWISHDDHYDFDYQQNRPVTPEVNVLPGDHLTYECTYTNTDRRPPTVTTGGLATTNEMCNTFILYYPRLPQLDICLSIFDPTTVLKGPGGIDDADKLWTIKRSELLQVLNHEVNWSDDFRAEYQQASRFDPHRVICKNYANLSQIPMKSPERTSYPIILEEYRVPQVCASGTSSVITKSLVVFLFTMATTAGHVSRFHNLI